jgi:hypothetical protein
MPSRRSDAAVTSPTPQSSSIDIGWRNATGSSTSKTPSGLHVRDATFATSFVGPPPTDASNSSSLFARARIAFAMSSLEP